MARKKRADRTKAGNKKQARGKRTVKDLEVPARKAKGVKGKLTLSSTDTLSLTQSLGAYTPLLVIAKNV